MDRNQHVKDYLKYYIEFPKPPHFAVLLNGPWGIGKTFLVKDFIKPFRDAGLKCAHVSLYGISSLTEIDASVLKEIYPRLGTALNAKPTKVLGSVARSVGKFFRVETDLKPTDILNDIFKMNADLFVFDDLERCELPINKVLGYINELVEHDDRKAIIIANEKEIKSSEEYSRIREKLIGKSFDIQSVFESALVSFIVEISDARAREFMNSKASEIGTLYHQSELYNLRILQQTLWDFERVFLCLEERHKDNNPAMTELFCLLVALSFEFRSGRLRADDLQGRQMAQYMPHSKTIQEASNHESQIYAAIERYPDTHVCSSILSDATLTDILCKGIVDESDIRRCLDVSSYFVQASQEPAWRVVWHAFERDDQEVGQAVRDMRQDFDDRKYTKTGEILHIFGNLLWLSSIGAINETRDQVVEQCRKYVDDLYARGCIEKLKGPFEALDLAFGGQFGLEVHESQTPEYRELLRHLIETRNRSSVDDYPAVASRLLETLKRDPQQFSREITLNDGGPNELYNVPVLAEMDADRFVEELIALSPADLRVVSSALRKRYQHGALSGDLAGERNWLTNVQDRIVATTKGASAFTRYRIKIFLSDYFEVALNSASVDDPPGGSS